MKVNIGRNQANMIFVYINFCGNAMNAWFIFL